MSIWAPRLPGARVLDLFAGSGAVGIEAVSRGATSTCLVEKEPRVVEQLAENCLLLDPGQCMVLAMDLPGGLSSQQTPLQGEFELIFADPPYDFDEFEDLASGVRPFLASGGEAVFEHSTRQDLSADLGGLERTGERCYGDTSFSFYRGSGVSQG